MILNKKSKSILSVVLSCLMLATLLSSCSDEGSPSQVNSNSSSETSSNPVDTSESSTPQGIVVPNEVAVARLDSSDHFAFFYNSDTDEYSQVNFWAPANMTLWDLVIAASGESGIVPQANSVLQSGKLITVDWTEQFVEESLSNKKTEQEFLSSVAMTLIQNQDGVEEVSFSMDGKAYQSANLTMQLGEVYSIKEIKLALETAEEYTKLRETVSYPGYSTLQISVNDMPGIYYTQADDQKIAEYILRVGKPTTTFTSVSQLGNDYLLGTAIRNTQAFYAGDENKEDTYYDASLDPIAYDTGEGMFLLKEHVEETAKRLFGSDVTVNHASLNGWTWHEKQGVYTPPSSGGSTAMIPILISKRTEGNNFSVKLAFGYYGMHGYLWENGNNLNLSNEAAINEYKENGTAYRLNLTNSGGSLYLESMAVEE